ncbi:MAG TPA: hypothetical protein VK427_22945 [Kofleriaceae bacterium]|nr:hypothetical protein [Kofleriaceae bacterium]
MKKLTLILALCACGGGSSKPASEPTTPVDPVPMTEPVATPTLTEPTTPARPTTPEPKADPKAELLAAEMSAFEKAKPVFDKWCAKCHAQGNKLATKKKLEHFDMTKYPFGGHHAMEVSKEIREVLGINGSKPTMPADKKGAVKGEELAAIKAWADAFDAAHAGGAHEGGAHNHGGHKH